MPGAFEGLRVIDLSWGMAGSLAGMLLADNGAEVLKVEPYGDTRRSEPGSLVWDRGKRSLALNLQSNTGADVLRKLAQRADVFIESNYRAELAQRGLTYDALAKSNPGLVYCAISPLGSQGPWKEVWGDDGLVHAKIGSMAAQVGFRDGGPVYVAAPVGSYGAASLATQGICAALHVRTRTGRGQKVETSLLQGILHYRMGAFQAERNGDAFVNPTFEARDPLGGVPFYNLNQCADGVWIQLGCQNPAFGRKAVVALGLDHLLEDPRWAGIPRRFQKDGDRIEIMEMVRQRLSTKTSGEWMAIFREQDVPASPVLTTEQFMDESSVKANDLVVSLDDLKVGPIRQIGLLARFSATPGSVRGPAPSPGQHTDLVLAELAGNFSGPWSTPASQRVAVPGPQPQHALEDIRVLDLSAFLAGPAAGRVLADLACDVIKIEPPEGDNFRLMAAAFIGANRGKRGIVLDLKKPADLDTFYRLVATADVVHQNFRPGVAERLRVDYATLQRIRPGLIYSHSTAFGAQGPDANRPAYDPVVSALSGIMAAQAGEGNPPAHYQISDLSSALAAATAVCMAIVARDRTGSGQLAETTMIAGAGYVNSEWFTAYRGRPARRIADKAQLGLNPIYRLYQTRSGWIFLGCVLPEHWEALRSHAELQGMQTVRYVEATRPANSALSAALDTFFRLRSAEEWEQELTMLGVPCAAAHRPLRDVLFSERALRDSGLVVEPEHPEFGKLTQPGLLVDFSETPGRIARMEPTLGQHTAEVLRELQERQDADQANILPVS